MIFTISQDHTVARCALRHTFHVCTSDKLPNDSLIRALTSRAGIITCLSRDLPRARSLNHVHSLHNPGECVTLNTYLPASIEPHLNHM